MKIARSFLLLLIVAAVPGIIVIGAGQAATASATAATAVVAGAAAGPSGPTPGGDTGWG
ncbi:hypothetical protein [Kitasatospora herbaricolor]|uniref:Uncharacterized protein n=1 Tax=Kitasatospora herbaricolor TaxID=68217 RepID=A0ABZ1W922_9ACTN|nr:hypothetical protein [Kitasatospora herbaricolor]